jgi:hypothetical protein
MYGTFQIEKLKYWKKIKNVIGIANMNIWNIISKKIDDSLLVEN